MKKKQTDETQTQNETELLYFRELLLIFLRLSTLSPLQPVTWQKINAFYGQDDLLKFKVSIRMGKKGDLSYFEHCIVVCARWAGMSFFKNC